MVPCLGTHLPSILHSPLGRVQRAVPSKYSWHLLTYTEAESDLASTPHRVPLLPRRKWKWEFLLEMPMRLQKLVEVGCFGFVFSFWGVGWEVGRVLLRTSELSKPLSSNDIKESSPFPNSSCYSRRLKELVKWLYQFLFSVCLAYTGMLP